MQYTITQPQKATEEKIYKDKNVRVSVSVCGWCVSESKHYIIAVSGDWYTKKSEKKIKKSNVKVSVCMRSTIQCIFD